MQVEAAENNGLISNLDNSGSATANQNLARPQGNILKQLNKGYYDGNADECGFCKETGKLICCDDCPAAFHFECLGYQSQKQCPRGKWKCYFCKVSKHGISFTQRMTPNEKALCADLMIPTLTW